MVQHKDLKIGKFYKGRIFGKISEFKYLGPVKRRKGFRIITSYCFINRAGRVYLQKIHLHRLRGVR